MNLAERVKQILLSPDTEWRVIAREPADPVFLLTNYVAYLATIPAVAGFVGMSVFGVAVAPVGALRVPVLSGLLAALFLYAVTFVMVYAIALVIDALAPTFAGEKNLGNALKLAVYSYTPFWLAGIFLLIPGLRFLLILGFYGLYLLYTGLPVLMRARPEKAFTYSAVVVACTVVLELIVRSIWAALFALPGLM